jgi:hypothetical protein
MALCVVIESIICYKRKRKLVLFYSVVSNLLRMIEVSKVRESVPVLFYANQLPKATFRYEPEIFCAKWLAGVNGGQTGSKCTGLPQGH